jgi:hypothetical protein
MRSIVAVSIVAVAFGCQSANALTDDLETFVEADWYGKAHANKTTGEFTGCTIESDYNSGASLMFRLAADFEFEIWVGHRDWLFPEGKEIPAKVTVDKVTPRTQDAIVVHSNFVAIPVGSSEESFDLFRRGAYLTVIVDDKKVLFHLDGTQRALTKLLECVEKYRQPKTKVAGSDKPEETIVTAPGAAVAVAATPNTAAVPAASADRSVFRLEATEFAANIASAAGLTGFRIISDAETRKQFGDPDALWEAGDLLGVANILDVGPEMSIDDAAAFGWYSTAGCEGGRSTAMRRERKDGIDIVNVAIECTPEEGDPVMVNKTVSPRPAGGYFEFGFAVAVGASSDDSASSPAQENLKDAVLEVLPR